MFFYYRPIEYWPTGIVLWTLYWPSGTECRPIKYRPTAIVLGTSMILLHDYRPIEHWPTGIVLGTSYRPNGTDTGRPVSSSGRRTG